MKICFALFILSVLLFPSSLFAGSCARIEMDLIAAEDSVNDIRTVITVLENKLKIARADLDTATRSFWTFDLNSLPQQQELHRRLQQVEELKISLQTEKESLAQPRSLRRGKI